MKLESWLKQPSAFTVLDASWFSVHCVWWSCVSLQSGSYLITRTACRRHCRVQRIRKVFCWLDAGGNHYPRRTHDTDARVTAASSTDGDQPDKPHLFVGIVGDVIFISFPKSFSHKQARIFLFPSLLTCLGLDMLLDVGPFQALKRYSTPRHGCIHTQPNIDLAKRCY